VLRKGELLLAPYRSEQPCTTSSYHGPVLK
jgi:hypothetical protein